MSLTPYPHGILATPLVGASRLADMWNSGNIWFVDGDRSNDGNGTSPDSGVALISTGVGLATKGGTVYVKPRTTTASAQTYYADNITIPITKPGLSIVGCGNNTGASTGVQVKPLAVGSHLITINGGGVLIENMRLTLTGGTAHAGKCIINAVRSASVTNVVADLTVRGCRIENDKSHPTYTGTTAVGAIGLGSANYVVIENNTFSQCLGSIVSQETNGVTRDLTIRGNIFGGQPAARDCDILLNLAASYNVNILGNVFSDGLPALTDGTYKKFIQIIGATATGVVSGNYFASTTTSFGSSGSECVIPDTFFFAGNYENAGLIAGA